MLFQSSNGKVFNSISLIHFKDRMGFCARIYAVCVESDNELYIILSDEDLNKCKSKANKFVKKYKAFTSIYYFARESADEFIQEFICHVNSPEKNNKYKCKNNKSLNNKSLNNNTNNKSVNTSDLNDYKSNYLNYINKQK